MDNRKLIYANELLETIREEYDLNYGEILIDPCRFADMVEDANAVDAIVLTPGYQPGDVCLYVFDNGNKSSAIVEIVKILDDERGAAEIKFLKVFVDDTGNGFFDYLLRTNQTMNASFKYLKNITPRGETPV